MTDPVDRAKLARAIETELERAGSPERAASEKRYLKSDMDFLGATLADIRRVARQAAKWLDRERAVSLVEELWSVPTFERRMAATLVLELRADDLRSEDLRMIERLIRESRTWALVDVLSGDVVGEMGLRLRIRGTLDRWARDDDFWVRRSSLLAELTPLKHGAPFDPFARRADAMLDETEFFIRKAIGWVLRETVKYLDATRAERLMRAYKEGRPAGRPYADG